MDEQNILSEEKVSEIENSVDPGSFDLSAFIDDRWDFPSFSATVYLDGASAGRIAELEDKVKELTKKSGEDKQTTGGLGALGAAQSSADAELEAAKAEIAKLRARVQTSSLKFVLKLSESSAAVNKGIDAELKKRFPKLTEKQLEQDPDAQFARMLLMTKACVHKVYNSNGAVYSGEISEDMLRKLNAKLVQSEWVKLQNNTLMAWTGGNVMQRSVDAGFPG